MSAIATKQHLLRSLLSPLVHEWGYDVVRRCLAELESLEFNHPEGDRQGNKPVTVKEKYRKPTAIDLINRIEAPEAKKALLLILASKFEAKEFLPTVADVRHFLEMRGQQVTGIKQRQDTFGKVLESLLSMPDDELDRVVLNKSHSGPSQLEPLSDAIRAASAAVRSSEPPTSAHQVDVDHPAPEDQPPGSTDKA